MVSNTPIECILDREHPSYLNLSVTERRPQVIIMGLTSGVATDNMEKLGLMHYGLANLSHISLGVAEYCLIIA